MGPCSSGGFGGALSFPPALTPVPHRSSRAAAAPRAPWAPPADATPRLQRAPPAPPVRLPEGPTAPSAGTETPWSPPPGAPAGTPALRAGGLCSPFSAFRCSSCQHSHSSKGLGAIFSSLPSPFLPPISFYSVNFPSLPTSSCFSSPGRFSKLLFTGFVGFVWKAVATHLQIKDLRTKSVPGLGMRLCLFVTS